uniref:Sensory box histidine kinase/response regulator n=1 Tax=uncultured bacterium contig00034 TaxID=1181523 RepID=A0A806KNI3_9BACT|nr:sensory box histidine kinase/response regulator [uncultured bacterium contig00034]
MLAPYGLKTDTASSGGEAIKRIEQGNAYDIIFMDHMMPVMDGVETTRRLREMGYKGKIIALTANVLAGQDEVFMRNGFDGFISKPIDSRELDGVLVGFIPAAPPVTPRLTPRAGTAAPDELKRCFVIDARRAIDTLEGFRAQGRPANDADFEGYTTVVHGMKSALANIGEADLSAAALRLENAGRARDAAFVTYKTPPFITALRKLSEELSAPDDSENVEMGDADRRLLREGLDALATACAAFDKPAAKAALDGLRQKKWPREVGGVLDEIAAHLLHSAFGKAAATAKSI